MMRSPRRRLSDKQLAAVAREHGPTELRRRRRARVESARQQKRQLMRAAGRRP